MIKIKKLYEDVELPVYATEGSAGLDLKAHNIISSFGSKPAPVTNLNTADFILMPGCRVLVGCGFAIELPEEGELQVRPRSGNAIKHGVTVLNSPGTIDEDYRGEVGVILINHSTTPFVIKKGDKIAQAVLHRYYRAKFEEVAELSETKRGEGGFGSTDQQKSNENY